MPQPVPSYARMVRVCVRGLAQGEVIVSAAVALLAQTAVDRYHEPLGANQKGLRAITVVNLFDLSRKCRRLKTRAYCLILGSWYV